MLCRPSDGIFYLHELWRFYVSNIPWHAATWSQSLKRLSGKVSIRGKNILTLRNWLQINDEYHVLRISEYFWLRKKHFWDGCYVITWGKNHHSGGGELDPQGWALATLVEDTGSCLLNLWIASRTGDPAIATCVFSKHTCLHVVHTHMSKHTHTYKIKWKYI